MPKRLVQYCGHAPACDDFASPTGNIRCFATAGYGRYVECDIASGLKPPPAKGSCDLDQPGLVVKATGVAAPDCRGDPTPAGLDDTIPALPYGQSWSRFGLSLHIADHRDHLSQRRRARVLPVAGALDAPLIRRAAAGDIVAA